jgi:murein DD-endopeptidase MepM/ murein hydrolase activator NlpD
MIHQRHPKLDLTTQVFSPRWWIRLGALLSLILGTVAIALTHSKHRPDALFADAKNASEKASGTSGTSSIGIDAAAIDIEAAYAAFNDARTTDTFQQPYGRVQTITLQKNETLGEALKRAGTNASQAFTALRALDKVKSVKSVRPGLEITLQQTVGIQPRLQSLHLKADFQSIARVTYTANKRYVGELLTLRTQQRRHVARGRIDASLYVAAERQGMPAATIISLIRALSYRVDFQREIRAGDQFAALYTMRAAADGSLSPGDIDYAELDLGDRVEKLYRFKNPKTGRIDFFDEKGESMRRLLMRTPIDGARLTSSFGRRKHPVLGYVKSHKGVDFGAATGTPIYAAGDGVVKRANRFGSYGNYVLISHPRDYKTAYAHLSRFARGMKAGTKVRQGQVIGYVGATGRVTGPHLHYEVYKGKVRVNPMRLDLPTGEVLTRSALTAFKAHVVQVEASMAGETAAR